MNENFNPEDPFGFDEPEQKQKEPKKLNWIQRIWLSFWRAIFHAMARSVVRAVNERNHRKKHYRHVIKQGWFGEYSEWHER